MSTENSKNTDVRRYAWKPRSYVVPSPSRKGFQWKVSALRRWHRLRGTETRRHPATIVVPALYNFLPAEAVAMGWFNEIDALATIRRRITEAAKVTGWDVFTFHTRHNLDPFYSTTIAAMRETWVSEGSLQLQRISETLKRYGAPYQYNCIPARLVENLVLQSSLMEWVSARSNRAPFHFHVMGTGLLSALVWSRALTFESAVIAAWNVGSRWEESLANLVKEEHARKGQDLSQEGLGWRRFDRVRQILEGRSAVSLGVSSDDVPPVDTLARPFWFSVTASDEPILLETVRDVQWALESMNLASWAPKAPRPLPVETADVKGWLVSPQHPLASVCRWSMYNYLLATPRSTSLFLDHIAIPSLTGKPASKVEEPQERLRVSRINVTGP